MVKRKNYAYVGAVLMMVGFVWFANFNSAAQVRSRDGKVPFWKELTSILTSLSEEAGVLECDCVISANEMDTPIVGTMSLEKKINGRWQRVIAWGIRDKGDADLTRRYQGVSGIEYRLKIYVQVGKEKVTEYSDTCIVK